MVNGDAKIRASFEQQETRARLQLSRENKMTVASAALAIGVEHPEEVEQGGAAASG